ncbi:PucR family transcriptional regulator [Streptomyces rugosispiralis]|uniref:Helix-turn-helix domain-containing protein n=1 Tax=Streptomyces rugosispiralis TaxID=2967341 RepID=A0ABT1UNZ8_9ACTN|nr:helix-turn-helix domain-containing protein [Streptomyces rugosispiralis]MCQ8186696.1 helix-turn-helix domain-containing protein [Streptomyces rugosispiralis]
MSPAENRAPSVSPLVFRPAGIPLHEDDAQPTTAEPNTPRAGVRKGNACRSDGKLSAVVDLLEAQIDRVAAIMVRAYRTEIAAYGEITDESLLQDILHVCSDTVRCCLEAMRRGRLREEELMSLTEGARRRAAQGINREAVLRAYRVGARVLCEEIVSTLAADSAVGERDIGAAAAWVLEFADLVCVAAAAAYSDEVARMARAPERYHRSQLLDAVLAGTWTERHRQTDTFAVPHCVAVAQIRATATFADLESIGRAMVSKAGASSWTVRHRTVVATLEIPDGTSRDHLIRRLRPLVTGQVLGFGLGYTAEGAAQTRHSHAEALDALRIGMDTAPQHGAQPVYDYNALAPLIAMLAEPDRARRFVSAALEPLSPMMDRDWVLPTIDAYLSRWGRLKEVASALGVHQNTVKYRVGELRPFVDLTTGGDRAAMLLLAVRVHEHLATVHAEPSCGGSGTSPLRNPDRLA